MDIFSLGCVIAELFLESPIFDISQLLKYRKGEYDPTPTLDKIHDPHIRDLIKHMIQKEPSSRFAAEKYLRLWTGKAFPSYFAFLHSYTAELMLKDADTRINTIHHDLKSNFILDNFTQAQNEGVLNFSLLRDVAGNVAQPSSLRQPREQQENNAASSNANSARSHAPLIKKDIRNTSPKDDTIPLLLDTETFIHHLEARGTPSFSQPSSPPSIAATEGASTDSNRTYSDNTVEDGTKRHITSTIINSETMLVEPPSSLPLLEDAVEDLSSSPPFNSENVVATTTTSSTTDTQDNTSPSSTAILQQTNTSTNSLGIDPITENGSSEELLSSTADSTGSEGSSSVNEGFVMILSMVHSLLRNVQTTLAKLTALDILSLLIPFLDNKSKLQRQVPYIVSQLSSNMPPLVRITALRTVTQVLENVKEFPPGDAHIFPEYILPALGEFHVDKEEMVRQALAENLARLAEVSRRFLEASQFFKRVSLNEMSGSSRNLLPYQGTYDAELNEIQEIFHDIVVYILTKETSSAVKRTLLMDITRLCIFFGREKTENTFLPHLSTLVNEHGDWELRCAFFHNIVGVSAFVGMVRLKAFILPCIYQCLTDEEEFVIDKAVNCMASLCELGLFRKPVLIEIAGRTAPMLFHPNVWIRFGVVAIMAAIAKQLSVADVYCFLIPILRPFLLSDIVDVTAQSLLEALKPPVSRVNFEKALYSIGPILSGEVGRIVSPRLAGVAAGDEPTLSPLSTPQTPRQPDAGGTIVTSDAQQRKSPIGGQRSNKQDDAFDIAFATKLSECGVVSEEMEKLQLMKEYLCSASRAINFKSSLWASKNEIDKSQVRPARPSSGRKQLSEYAHLSRSIPVHTAPLPYLSSKKARSMSEAGEGSSGVVGGLHSSNNPPSSDSLKVAGGLGGTAAGTAIPGGATMPNLNNSGLGANGPATPLPENTAVHSRQRSDAGLHVGGGGSGGGSGVIGGSIVGTGYSATGEQWKDWRPRGVLVAHLHEHQGAVNQLRVSRDNLFFASCSDDGTVKIWDSQRLEKNVTIRSRLTYSAQGGKVTSIAICENTHTVASGSDNGSIHLFNVEYTTKKEGSVHRYTGMSTIKCFDGIDGSVVQLEHYNDSNQSLLVYGTTKGVVRAFDLRSDTTAWLMQNDNDLGLLQHFVIDPQRNWLITATSRGFFTLWDIRFNIPTKTWRHSRKHSIHSVLHFNTTKSNSCIFAASGSNEVDLWDVETGSCVQLFRAASPSSASATTAVLSTSAMNSGANGATASSTHISPFIIGNYGEGSPSTESSNSGADATGSNRFSGGGSSTTNRIAESRPHRCSHDFGMDDLHEQMATPYTSHSIHSLLSPPNCSWLITGGTDKKIRFWDINKAATSYVISGLAEQEQRPRYGSLLDGGTTVFQELLPNYRLSADGGSTGTASTSGGGHFPDEEEESVSSSSSSSVAAAYLNRQPMGRSTPAIHHNDCITALEVLELPHRMLISGSRDGVVKVWK
ncbi:Serine/threonine-protein kinase, variant 2 [Balamuthia mandrillaris]